MLARRATSLPKRCRPNMTAGSRLPRIAASKPTKTVPTSSIPWKPTRSRPSQAAVDNEEPWAEEAYEPVEPLPPITRGIDHASNRLVEPVADFDRQQEFVEHSREEPLQADAAAHFDPVWAEPVAQTLSSAAQGCGDRMGGRGTQAIFAGGAGHRGCLGARLRRGDIEPRKCGPRGRHA